MHLIEGGSLDPASTKFAKAKLKSDSQEVTIIWTKCTLSMKSEVYSVFLVFDEEGYCMTGPSKCNCPNRNWFCSHMIANMMFVLLLQLGREWKWEDLVILLPEPIKSI